MKAARRTAAILIIAAYILMVTHDLFYGRLFVGGDGTKLFGVFCCVVLAWLGFLGRRSRTGAMLCAAMTLTLCADVFLIFIPSLYTVGIAVFCLAQTARIVQFTSVSLKQAGWIVLSEIAAAAGLALLGVAPFYAVGGVYAVLIITAAALAFARAAAKPTALRRRAGMVLFLLCDVCVLICNVSPRGGIAYRAAALIWLFYLPSQLILASEKADKSAAKK